MGFLRALDARRKWDYITIELWGFAGVWRTCEPVEAKHSRKEMLVLRYEAKMILSNKIFRAFQKGGSMESIITKRMLKLAYERLGSIHRTAVHFGVRKEYIAELLDHYSIKKKSVGQAKRDCPFPTPTLKSLVKSGGILKVANEAGTTWTVAKRWCKEARVI